MRRTFFSSRWTLSLRGIHLSRTLWPSTMKADTLLSEPSAARESSIQSVLDGYGLELTPDSEFVRWSASNRRHPRNWGALRKTYDCSLIIFLDLFT